MDTREPGRIYAAGQPFGPGRPPVPPAPRTPPQPVGSSATTGAPVTASAPVTAHGMSTQPIVMPTAAPVTYKAGQAGRGGQVPLSERRWLLPVSVGVLVTGLLVGGVMAAFAPPSSGGPKTGALATNRAPLPGELAGPAPLAEQSASTEASPSDSPSPSDAPTDPPSPQVPPVGTLHTASGRCLEVENKDNGARTRERDCNGAPEQRWMFTPAGPDGQYLLINQSSGKCLDVNDRSKDDGAVIQQWDCNNGDNQKWFVRWQADAFALVSVNSGRCANVEDDQLKQRDCRDVDSQRWKVQA
jgi:hypothetical protein